MDDFIYLVLQRHEVLAGAAGAAAQAALRKRARGAQHEAFAQEAPRSLKGSTGLLFIPAFRAATAVAGGNAGSCLCPCGPA